MSSGKGHCQNHVDAFFLERQAGKAGKAGKAKGKANKGAAAPHGKAAGSLPPQGQPASVAIAMAKQARSKVPAKQANLKACAQAGAKVGVQVGRPPPKQANAPLRPATGTIKAKAGVQVRPPPKQANDPPPPQQAAEPTAKAPADKSQPAIACQKKQSTDNLAHADGLQTPPLNKLRCSDDESTRTGTSEGSSAKGPPSSIVAILGFYLSGARLSTADAAASPASPIHDIGGITSKPHARCRCLRRRLQ